MYIFCASSATILDKKKSQISSDKLEKEVPKLMSTRQKCLKYRHNEQEAE